MAASEPSYPETLNLLAFAQQGDGEALLLFEGTLYVDIAVVDAWLSRTCAMSSRGNPLLSRIAERIRKAKVE